MLAIRALQRALLVASAAVGSVAATAAATTQGTEEVKVVHQGQCHCGAVRFQATSSPHLIVWHCNCSVCAMKQVRKMHNHAQELQHSPRCAHAEPPRGCATGRLQVASRGGGADYLPVQLHGGPAPLLLKVWGAGMCVQPALRSVHDTLQPFPHSLPPSKQSRWCRYHCSLHHVSHCCQPGGALLRRDQLGSVH